MAAKIRSALARLIPLRPWISLALLVTGIVVTVPAFWLHDLWLALIGLVPLVGALAFLLIPLPHPR